MPDWHDLPSLEAALHMSPVRAAYTVTVHVAAWVIADLQDCAFEDDHYTVTVRHAIPRPGMLPVDDQRWSALHPMLERYGISTAYGWLPIG